MIGYIIETTKRIIGKRVDNLKENPYYKVIGSPQLYLKSLGINTLLIGILVFVINLCYIYSPLHTVKIPNGIHSLVGFVIALLLVFRTNTAYDRWWEGRKKLNEMNSSCSFFIAILSSTSITNNKKDQILISVFSLLDLFKEYIKGPTSNSSDIEFHTKIISMVSQISMDLRGELIKSNLTDNEFNFLRNCLKELMESITSCERIKNTPIPFSYYIHIKITILVYLMTLPFSMFYDLNLWSTPVIMALYFIIAGIEIISSEIENPFSGEPNDLPTDVLVGNIQASINKFINNR